jgi:hypothetical protein
VTRAFVPRAMMARKPPHGDPCTRCGVCCVATLCELGRHLFGDQPGPCPGLLLDGEGRAACAPATIGDRQHKDAAFLLIGAGDGCDARFNGEFTNHQFHQKCDALDVIRSEQIRAARAIWKMED